jgi:sugar lactone lactonase YvrE
MSEIELNMNNVRILVDNLRGLKFTESPRWRDGKWWFLDIHGHAIKTVDLDGSLETILEVPFKPNGFGFHADGSLIFSDALQRRIYRWDGKSTELMADLSAITVFCLSDGFVDNKGRMYIGDIGYNFFDPTQNPVDTCVIVCVDPDGSSRVVTRGLSFPNGMAITPDGMMLIVAETMGHRLTAFDILADGALANRRVFAQLPDNVHPDGIALDAEGAVWVASPESQPTVLRVREGGEIVERIEMDTHAYAVMLGGPERRHLLISASNSHNPAEIATSPSATLRVVEVQVPGAGRP